MGLVNARDPLVQVAFVPTSQRGRPAHTVRAEPIDARHRFSRDSDKTICVVVKQDLITATAALSGLASILFGFFTNLPVALA